jgi:hypothetical protein
MKKPFVLIAAIVAVVGFGAVAAVAKKTTKAETSVKLNPSDGNSFSGTVEAKHGCQKGRKVTLTYGNKKLASDRSNDRGKYKIFYAIHDSSGNYRAVASKRKVTKNDGDTIICKRGRSKQVYVYARQVWE